MVGAGQGDDAAVWRLDKDRALVATVDFFTPIVDRPQDFGAIAAANSLSDVYAMGGRPLFAMALVAFPRERLATGLLEAIVSGGAAKLGEAGVPVVGGHSVDDPEPKFGYAVVGEVEPERILKVTGARPGDLLYLTKPLGSGIVATALKRGLCPPALERAATAVMEHLNRAASAAMVAGGATAATDVTGYGLSGHLLNMGVGAEVVVADVPLLPGVRELAARDLFPDGTRRNLASAEGRVDWDGLPEVDRLLMSDAQTSGGLLVALPEAAAPEFEAAMSREPYGASRIGVVTDGPVRFRA